MFKYEVILSKNAENLLRKIKDNRERKLILASLQKLEFEPEKRGKPLTQDLQGYYSLRVVGQRYRVIYRIEQERIVVVVVSIGIRKQGDKQDIYEITKKLISEFNDNDV